MVAWRLAWPVQWQILVHEVSFDHISQQFFNLAYLTKPNKGSIFEK